MNNQNRKELKTAIALIEQAREIIERMKEEEQTKFDNLSEGLQQTEQGVKFEETFSTFEDVCSELSEAVTSIEESM